MAAGTGSTTDLNSSEKRRAVEALAEALYEANNAGGVAWVKRPRIVRDPWLARARQQLSQAEQVSCPDASAPLTSRDNR